jgi:HEPN domain-containing protein/predicted nucleotidyltransferase
MVDSIAAAEPQIESIVDAIRERLAPELILLFGSRARGDVHADSDYDVMLVLRDDADVERDRRAAWEALRAKGIPADVLASSTSDYRRRQHDPGFLSWLVSREGRLLYTAGTVAQRSPRPPRVSEQPREGLEMWMERAEEDFREAQLSINAARPGLGAICFHSHACVEKLLKALLVSRGKHPPKTHELLELVALQSREVSNDTALSKACVLLHGLYPKSRYPEVPMPALDEARQAFAAAQLVRDRVLPLFKKRS